MKKESLAHLISFGFRPAASRSHSGPENLWEKSPDPKTREINLPARFCFLFGKILIIN